MTQFTITLERTVTTREVGQVTVDAADLGAAERLARARVQGSQPVDVDWRIDMEEAGRVVVIDVEERIGGPGSPPPVAAGMTASQGFSKQGLRAGR